MSGAGKSVNTVRLQRVVKGFWESAALMSAVELERMVARENLRMRLRYLFRHPVRAAERYSAYIRKDPRVVYKSLTGYMRKSLGFA